MGGKKPPAENTKKVAGNAKKAAAAADKAAAENAKKAAVEDKDWAKGEKSSAKKYASLLSSRSFISSCPPGPWRLSVVCSRPQTPTDTHPENKQKPNVKHSSLRKPRNPRFSLQKKQRSRPPPRPGQRPLRRKTRPLPRLEARLTSLLSTSPLQHLL
jgi:hypothetical protein